jgi:signal transduction histidine kinase
MTLSLCLAVAVLAGGYALWARRHWAAASLALAAALWGLRSLLWWWPDTGLPPALRLGLLDLGFGVATALACDAALRLAGVPMRRWRHLLAANLLVQVGAAPALALGASVVWRAAAQNLLVVACIAVLLRLAWQARRPGRSPARVVGLGGLAMLLCSGHDHWALFLSTAPEAYSRLYLTPIGLPIFLLACGWLLVWRVRRALRAEALAQRLRERRADLRRQAAEQERQRLLRQFHDGLGAQLVGLLSAVQRRSVAPPQIEQALRDTLDDLRLSLDLMDEEDRELGDLLGQLRFRLAPRLQQAGLTLHWRVPVADDLPGPPGLQQPGGADRLRRWVQEALTNVLKHAQASEVTVSAGPGWLSVEDDGIGWPRVADGARHAGAVPSVEGGAGAGRGLRHMAESARALGATVERGPARAGQGDRPGLRWTLRWAPDSADLTNSHHPATRPT